MKFEDKIEKIDNLVKQLENGEISIDDALKCYEDAIKICGDCLQSLKTAKGKVEILNSEIQKMEQEIPTE